MHIRDAERCCKGGVQANQTPVIPDLIRGNMATPLKLYLSEPGGCPCQARAMTAPIEKAPQTFSTWPNSSSTGVARPKMETATFRRERASSTSSTIPLNEAKGPSATFTVSPTS